MDLSRSENLGGQDEVRKALVKIWSFTLAFIERLSSQVNVDSTQTRDFISESRAAILEVNQLLMPRSGFHGDLRLSEEASTSFSSEL